MKVYNISRANRVWCVILGIVFLVVPLVLFLDDNSIVAKTYMHLLWIIPGSLFGLLYLVPVFWYLEIKTDQNGVTQRSIPLLMKVRHMEWEEIHYINIDNLFFEPIVHIRSERKKKPRKITIFQVKYMDDLIAEIVSRSPNAYVEPEIQKIVKERLKRLEEKS